MVYKALYRTYRPKDFNELVGQDHIVKTIQNAIKQDKIAHAYLFTGPRGTGKTTIAKLVAKAINCTSSSEDKPCNQCENCISITNGEHQDIIEIDAASNNGVDEVRDLIEKVKYAPIKAKFKVYIIDEVHMMSTGAFNALLKTLEEPPAHVVFILATTEPHKILPTIISRCQRFDFKKISTNEIENRLFQVLEKENINCEHNAVQLIASLADGGMRDALSILEQCLAYSPNLTVDDVNKVYGIVSISQKIEFVKGLINKDVKKTLQRIDEMFLTGIDIKRLTTDLIDILKDVIIYKNTNEYQSMLVLSKDEVNEISPYMPIEDTFEYIQILLDVDQKYKQATNSKLYFEIAMLKIINNKELTCNTKKENITNQIEYSNKKLHENSVINKKEVKEEIYQTEENDCRQNTNGNDIVKKCDNNQNVSVSDETILAVVEVSFDNILNILVQAKRDRLNMIQEKWNIIRKYQVNLNTAKYASMLCDGKPVAACEGGLIITFDHLPLVNKVNSNDDYMGLKMFIKEVLGEEYDFIGVLANEWPNIRNEFIKLNKEGKLPKPQKISLDHIDGKEELIQHTNYSEAQQYGIELFGEIVEIKEKE